MQTFPNADGTTGTTVAQVPVVTPRRAQFWPQGHNPLRGVVPCAKRAPISCATFQGLSEPAQVKTQKIADSRTRDFLHAQETQVKPAGGARWFPAYPTGAKPLPQRDGSLARGGRPVAR